MLEKNSSTYDAGPCCFRSSHKWKEAEEIENLKLDEYKKYGFQKFCKTMDATKIIFKVLWLFGGFCKFIYFLVDENGFLKYLKDY